MFYFQIYSTLASTYDSGVRVGGQVPNYPFPKYAPKLPPELPLSLQ